MKKHLRIVLILQVAYFLVWGIWLLTSHLYGQDVWLETSPVDPRDLISGHYVRLDYPIARVPNKTCDLKNYTLDQAIYVELEKSPLAKKTSMGQVNLWTAKRCQLEPPKTMASQAWVKGQIKSVGDQHVSITYGIEKYFIPENSTLRTAQSGQVVAKARIGRNLTLRVLELTLIF